MHVWRYIYFAWAILCLVGGYRNLAPEHTAQFFMPWWFIVESFFFFCIAPLAITALRNRFGFETVFLRPSLDRTVFSRRDILQAFQMFYMLLGTFLCFVIGAAISKHFAGVLGTLLFYVVAFGGSFANAFCIIWLAGYRRKNENAQNAA